MVEGIRIEEGKDRYKNTFKLILAISDNTKFLLKEASLAIRIFFPNRAVFSFACLLDLELPLEPAPSK